MLFLCVVSAVAQSNEGELRLKVTDPSGLGIKCEVKFLSEVSQYQKVFTTSEDGTLIAKRLPFGIYQVQIQVEGFAPVSESIDIRSAVPSNLVYRLMLAPVSTSLTVSDSGTLIDPYRAGSVNQIGSGSIQDRLSSLPGRSLQDLVNSQPGWLYEGNAVLHPRGSEYQTQVVVDGIPLTDNRSPSFGPEIEADDIDSVKIYTAGIPAEFGRKMGGVIEVDTLRAAEPGIHGQMAFSGGSFDTAGTYGQVQYSWQQNTLGVSATGNMTNHYLNPVVPQNYTNHGTTGGSSLHYERELTPTDRLSLIVRRAVSQYQVPNELVQETAGQLQNGDNFETSGTISYQHIVSSDTIGWLRGMVRDNSNDLFSNQFSTPVIAIQHNYFKEGYLNGSISTRKGRHEWKVGVESDVLFLHESLSDEITDPTRFDAGTPANFTFDSARPNLEQSAFVQDAIRLGKWTMNAGARWDHYQLLANQNAISPRLSVARYFSSADLTLHASYDRVFQTPSFENILLSSSPAVQSLNPSVLRLPVQPSHGNYYEVGMTKGFFGKLRLDANYFRRSLNNFADDDQILNTAVSFPIAFAKALIYGAEAKVEVPHWGRLSGFASYSYEVGNVWFPVTGGLFLGDEAVSAKTQLTGHFPDSQDQRNTLRSRLRYQLTSRLWVAGGGEYGSGLPFDFASTYQDALAQYGQEVVGRINFVRGRIKPVLSINVSVGADICKKKSLTIRLQADGENLNNRLNLLDFGGLFSGNAIASPRGYFLRLVTKF
jgi:outer membrane cobalamin receptor